MRILSRFFLICCICLCFFLRWSVNDFLKQNWNFKFFKWGHWQFVWNEIQNGLSITGKDSSGFFCMLLLAVVLNIACFVILFILLKKAVGKKNGGRLFGSLFSPKKHPVTYNSEHEKRPYKLEGNLAGAQAPVITPQGRKIKPPKERPAPANGYKKVTSPDAHLKPK